MELLEVFYRRKLRKKQKKLELGRSDGALCRAPSEASINNLATGLISKVLRFTSRRSEPASRPHSWHSTKLGEGQPEFDQAAMDTMSSAWHHSYHASASTADLSSGFDSGGDYLRKSPDQYSSRGSMESLDPSQSTQLHSAVQNQHPLSHHGHTGSHPAYSSCHQLSSARSSNSIDHLHSKRDSAYSSFSTSSSIPEYLASTPSFSPERSCSLETVPQRSGGSAEMLQEDVCFVRTSYDAQQGLSEEHELGSASAALLSSSDSRGGVRSGLTRDLQGSVSGVCYRGNNSSKASGSGRNSMQASNRHSVGPIWGPTTSYNSYESLKGAPAPPRRSDSYAAIRNHERPNSWSSLEHARSLRSLQKGSWHHSSGPVASAKALFGPDGQLHTVIEKSPESSPTTKPRQGGGSSQPPSPTGPSLGSSAATSSNRLILPSGVYSVPQPESHFTQISCPPGVYPTQQQPRPQVLNGRGEVGLREDTISTTENGHQSNNSSSSPHFSYSASSSQLRTQALEADRHRQQESSAGTTKTHSKTTRGGFLGQNGAQRPQNNQEAFSQNLQGSQSQEQNQDFRISGFQSGSDLRTSSSQEKRDPRERSRSRDQTNIHSEPEPSSRLAQGQVRSTCHSTSQPHPLAPPTSTSQVSPRHVSDSAAPQWNHRDPDKDSEHPLTRLEIALAEVQCCTSPDSVFSGGSHDNASVSNDTQGPARSLSVLEKVSRFERREHGGKQRSQSTSNLHNKAAHLWMTDKSRGPPCGAEDLRNMLERSTKGAKAQRKMSYRGSSSEHVKHRTPADSISAPQRSSSSFQLDGSKEGDAGKDFPWKQEMQDIMDHLQEMSSNRSYRDSLKDAQSNVLQSTSFRRKDSSNTSPSSAVPPPVTLSSSQQPPPLPAKTHSLEKKGPKTKPKPHGVLITQQSLGASPHTPKERHVVSPDVRGESPPPLPSIPPVGPPLLTRVCGRKRLTGDQKKRSYSEPENMNEVGVSDPETTALFRRGGETSVADRRKMFELAAIRVGNGSFQNAMSRSDLRQLRQDALAEYVERKRGVRREDGAQMSRSRPRSAYFQPDNNHTDTFSLSSTSSLLSLQETASDHSFLSGETRPTVPPGGDLQSFQSNLFYPGRVTTPRPPAQPIPSGPADSTLEFQTRIYQDPEAGISRQSRSLGRDSSLGQDQRTAESQLNKGISKKLNEVLQRAGSPRRSGRSASAEDLLECLESQPRSPQHHRSRSSPTTEKLNQDFLSHDVKMFGVSFSEPGRCPLAADRPADIYTSEEPVCPQLSRFSESPLQPAGPSPDLFHTPVTRRDRQKNSERQRGHSASTLAASVGLPCPFSSPGTEDGGTAEWTASERLSQANLNAIAFPNLPQTTEPHGDRILNEKQTRRSLCDVLENATKDEHRNRTFSLETTGRPSAGTTRPVSCVTSAEPSNSSTPPPSSHPSSQQHLSSLRISESSLFSSFEQQQLESLMGKNQESFDEVFLQNPPPPPLTPLLKETNITEVEEDFPPPPPPLELEPEHQSVKSSKPESVSIRTPSSESPSPPLSSSITTSSTAEDKLFLEYEPPSRREKTREELRVEALAHQLVLQDPTLVPLLDTWGGKSMMELMEEIFPKCRLTDESQQRDGERSDERIRDDGCSPAQSSAIDQRKETNLDDEETDLNAKKVALCEALRCSVAVLQQEKQALSEELKHHQAVGSSIEALIQEQLKPNEKEKYSMFIGDLERIVNLLLSLCSRLSRIDRSLFTMQREGLKTEDTVEEKDALHHKRSLLLRQTEDARELKENLDRRQRVVHAILSGYLTEPQLQEYRRFVSAKPSLLIRQRHLDDLIRQGEEQLTRLAESLPAELAETHSGTAAGLLSGSSSYSCLVPPPEISSPAHSVRSTTVTSL